MNGYQRVYATQKPEREHRSDLRQCPRCGIERRARNNATLCESCRSVTTPRERERWAA